MISIIVFISLLKYSEAFTLTNAPQAIANANQVATSTCPNGFNAFSIAQLETWGTYDNLICDNSQCSITCKGNTCSITTRCISNDIPIITGTEDGDLFDDDYDNSYCPPDSFATGIRKLNMPHTDITIFKGWILSALCYHCPNDWTYSEMVIDNSLDDLDVLNSNSIQSTCLSLDYISVSVTQWNYGPNNGLRTRNCPTGYEAVGIGQISTELSNLSMFDFKFTCSGNSCSYEFKSGTGDYEALIYCIGPPTLSPTRNPTPNPTTRNPTRYPTTKPTHSPTTTNPTHSPTTTNPTTTNPTHSPNKGFDSGGNSQVFGIICGMIIIILM